MFKSKNWLKTVVELIDWKEGLTMFDAITKLLDVKSLVTIAMTIAYIVMACRSQLNTDFNSVYLVIISFYFGTQYQKNQQEVNIK